MIERPRFDVVIPTSGRASLDVLLAGLTADLVGLQRSVSGPDQARWATADLAFRRAALEAVGGFDERFPRAYRDHADLGLRLAARGLRIVEGRRRVLHSAALPAAAIADRIAGTVRARRRAHARGGGPVPAPPLAVLLDRDGTLIHDVPYNGDPDLVLPMTGARRALDRLRDHGVRLAIVSNQSGIGRGLLTSDRVAGVTLRVVELLGPFDDVRWCPHVAADGCDCRKPAPALLLASAEALGVDPLRCAVIGDIGADLAAARAAGMRGVLVPTASTPPQEVAAAPERAATLGEAVDLLLRAPVTGPPPRLRPAGRATRGRPPLERVA